MPRITRRVLLQSTAAIGLAKATKAAERTAAPAVPPLAEARKTYIGAPTSRIDGPAKVTGAAKYAAEFGAPDLSLIRDRLAHHQGAHRSHQLQRSTAGARRARSTHA